MYCQDTRVIPGHDQIPGYVVRYLVTWSDTKSRGQVPSHVVTENTTVTYTSVCTQLVCSQKISTSTCVAWKKQNRNGRFTKWKRRSFITFGCTINAHRSVRLIVLCSSSRCAMFRYQILNRMFKIVWLGHSIVHNEGQWSDLTSEYNSFKWSCTSEPSIWKPTIYRYNLTKTRRAWWQ